jgi:hypothetical protein
MPIFGGIGLAFGADLLGLGGAALDIFGLGAAGAAADVGAGVAAADVAGGAVGADIAGAGAGGLFAGGGAIDTGALTAAYGADALGAFGQAVPELSAGAGILDPATGFAITPGIGETAITDAGLGTPGLTTGQAATMFGLDAGGTPFGVTGVDATGTAITGATTPLSTVGGAVDPAVSGGGGVFNTLPGVTGGGAGAGTDMLTATAMAPTGGGAPADALTGGSTFGSLLGKAGTWAAANPLSAASLGVAGGGLLYNMITGQKQLPEQTALANQIGATNKMYNDYLSGKLPPGYTAAIQSATAAAKATAISNAASQGLPTDAKNNTALAATLAGIDRQALILTEQIASQILQSGLQVSGLDAKIYQILLQADQAQATATGNAIANVASALGAAGRPTISLKAAT